MREGLDLREWILKVEDERPRIDALVLRLMTCGAKVELDEESNDVASLHYSVKFFFQSDVVVTIGIMFMDHQTESDLVIETMTTLPATYRGQGFGSQAVSQLLRWAHENKLKEIRAVQVHGQENEDFWKKHYFTRAPEPNDCNDFLWHPPQ